MNETPLYYTIVFLQGDEAHEALDLLEHSGEKEALNYLKQWDYGAECEHGARANPWGTADEVHLDGAYIMTWNRRLQYIGLCRRAGKEEYV